MIENLFYTQLAKKILILDGAMGTVLLQSELTPADFGGEEYEGCNEILNLTKPELIRAIHEQYLEAGADIIETNTFGATTIVLAEYGIAEQDISINQAAARLAREAADSFSTTEQPRFVAGSLGPTTKSLSLTGGVTFDQLAAAYRRQAKALIEGGVDVLLLETAQDTLNVKAAGVGIQQAFMELEQEVPVMISGTIEPMGTTLAGQNIEAFYISIEYLHPVSVGLNCATGPEFMRDHVRSLAKLAHCGVSCYPNAGLPDEDGHYHETPQALAQKMAGFAAQGWLNIAGGCCGTTPAHVQALAEALRGFAPRTAPRANVNAVAGIEAVFLEEDSRPILVGERTNVIGSRQFRQLIAAGLYEEGAAIAGAQVKRGAQVIDICLADPDRDEYEDLANFLPYVMRKVKAPLMFDSTNSRVLELGLKHSQGKALLNSVNLEDGEQRFQEVLPLVRRYGASVIVGMIDEQGMAVSLERKRQVVQRAYDLLVHKYAIPAQDIIFDPLVFPVGTGDKQYLGSAAATIEGIRMVKQEMPECKTVLGISNVSFGLPPAGREVLNAVFLYHATKAGLDYAIVNTEKLQRYASISEEERILAENLLFKTSDENVALFTEFYRQKKTEGQSQLSNLTLEERLARYVIEGSKDGLVNDLQAALAKYSPLEIINGVLMSGMEEVGRLFNDNKLIVVEVLQSAEVMKAAVSYLEQFMAKSEVVSRGKILLASVKGDVHDIGKNLVEIILANNGYEVINLGIKVTPQQLIEACRREQPAAIGLSGLLVKSAQQMIVTAQDLRTAGIDIPLVVGGAALTRKFTKTRIAPEYTGLVLHAKDAMDGLNLVNRLQDPPSRAGLLAEWEVKPEMNEFTESTGKSELVNELTANKPQVSNSEPVFLPPDCQRHVLKDYSLGHLQPYLNLKMLFGKHLGVRGSITKLLAEGDSKVSELYSLVDEFLTQRTETGQAMIQAHGIYQFFPAQAQGNDILIYDCQEPSRVIERFTFPRQVKEPYLCLADYVRPVDSGEMDYVGMFALTTGLGIRDEANILKEQGEYLRSHVLQALALELAEAFAERLHQVMRDSWGFPDPVQMTMQDRFTGKYQGLRVSFGYPACPNMEEQQQLFRLLKPEDIGIELTEGLMMDPEASVTGMVFAHPAAHSFSALLTTPTEA